MDERHDSEGRVLTEAEERRKAHFEELMEQQSQEGYHADYLILDLRKVNIMATIIAIVFFALAAMLYWITGHMMNDMTIWMIVAYFIAFFVLVILHELIHGVTWAIFAPHGFHSIEFGYIKKTMNPYATCSEPMSKGKYILGAAMPTILLGIIPLLFCYFHPDNHTLVFIVAASMTVSGLGDAAIIWKILRHRKTGKEEKYLDHPYEAGVVVLTR